MRAKRRSFNAGDFRNLYCDLMEEVKRRVDVVSHVTGGGARLPALAAYELCYLQLRFVCELIALGCLAAHGDIHHKVGKRLLRDYNADHIIKGLSDLHPDFYPRPTRQIKDDETGRPVSWKPIEDGYLTKDELLKLYGACGDVLHRGGFDRLLRPREIDVGLAPVEACKERIVTLLNHHQIQLIDPDQLFVVLMQAESDGKVHGAFMVRKTN